MSVSIHEDPAEHEEGANEDARSVLSGWLDDYAAGRCERADMEESFLSVCRSNPDAPWDALALLDQYQRLGRIDAEVVRDLKTPIAQLVFGVPGPKSAREAPRSAPPSPPTPKARPPLKPAEDRSTDETGDLEDSDLEDSDIEEGEIDADQTSLRQTPPQTPPQIPPDRTALRRPFERQSPAPTRVTLREPRQEPVPPTAFHHASETHFRDVKRMDPAPKSERVEPGLRRASPPPAKRAGLGPKEVLRDRYELLSVLGRGHSGTVYKALDRHRANLSESARYVAVKVLKADYAHNAEALAEFEREFHQAQSLSHPNIASVFDFDRDGDTHFIVMELLHGELLADVLRRLDNRPMARQHALALVGSLGAALAHAHRRDIVHGDLKPRNIMITSMGEMRVLDFGFARSHALQSGELESGHEAVSFGTSAYASAERVHGMPADPSDDVYSLACIAYELLSGRHPYGGRSALLARAHGRRAQRIPGLTHKQWHALQRALAWSRAERKIDIVDLLAALGTAESPQELVPPELLSLPDDAGSRRWRAIRMALLLVAAIAAVVFLITRIPAPPPSVDVDTVAPSAPPTDAETLARDSNPDADRSTPQSPAADAPEATSAPTQSAPRESAPSEQLAAAAPETETTSARASASPGSNASAGPPPAAGAGGTIQFDKDTYVATESDASVRLVVKRSGAARGVLNFRWTLRGNSAEAGADFAGIGPGVEQMPSGARTHSVTIPLVTDGLAENTELFLVELEAIDAGVTLGELSHAAVIVVDDD